MPQSHVRTPLRLPGAGIRRRIYIPASGFVLALPLVLAPPVGAYDSPSQRFQTASEPRVAVGDLNGDRRPDVAMVSNDSTGVLFTKRGSVPATATRSLAGVPLYTGPLFSSMFQLFDVGPEPSSVAVADFNGDGRPDLAVANAGDPGPGPDAEYPGAVSVLLGNADGTYAARIVTVVGFRAASVASADLDGDGRADLVAANWGSSALSVLRGNGDGTFVPPVDYASGFHPVAVTIADLNADGRLDLAAANYDGYSVSVLLGNGDGSFHPRSDFGAGVIPFSIAAADLNGDGKLDLVAVNRGATVSVLLGNGDGTFGADTEYEVGQDSRGVAVGDLNGDKHPDLVVANLNSFTITLLFGKGDGTFGGRSDLGTSGRPHDVAIADMNADGWPDLEVAIWDGAIEQRLGHGDGTFAQPTGFFTNTPNLEVVVADLNRDGRLDVAACGNGSVDPHEVAVLIGNGDGTFGPHMVRTDSEPWAVAAADMDGNGTPDLVTANRGSSPSFVGTISVRLGNGDGNFEPGSDYPVGAGNLPTSVAVGDLNADGRPDVAVARGGANGVSVLLGTGGGSLGPPADYVTGTRPIQVAIADLDKDGHLDLATANSEANAVSVLHGNGDGTFAPRVDFDAGGRTSSIAVADLNADGYPDLAVVKYLTSKVGVMFGGHGGTFTTPGMEFATAAGPERLAIADLDGDGRPDLAVTTDSHVVSVLLNGRFTHRTDFDMGQYPMLPVIADFDADGRPDIAAANYEASTVSVLLGNGDGSFGEVAQYGCGVAPYWAAAADFDRDGRLDLAVTNTASNTVAVLRNLTAPAPPVPVPDPGRDRAALALRGPVPNPTVDGRMAVAFTLVDGSPARLELLDVAGRLLRTRRVESFGAGRHTVDLSMGRALSPGIYLVRLTQGGRAVYTRAAILK